MQELKVSKAEKTFCNVIKSSEIRYLHLADMQIETLTLFSAVGLSVSFLTRQTRF